MTGSFHIEIRGRTGIISDLARAQSGHRRACGMELVSWMRGARFGQQGVGTRAAWDFLTGLQI